MSAPLGHRTIALLVLATLGAMALLALGSAADATYQDWRVFESDHRVGETIVVEGTMAVELGASLSLEDCILQFTGGDMYDTRIDVRDGTLRLDGTNVLTQVPGTVQVSGHLILTGDVRLYQMGIKVQGTGTMAIRDATFDLEGLLERDTEVPALMTVHGALNVHDSRVDLRSAFITTSGTTIIDASFIDSSYDYSHDYRAFAEHLRFTDGEVTLTDSTFKNMWRGIESQAALLSVEGCTFNGTDLRFFVPYWHKDLLGRVIGSHFRYASATILVESHDHDTPRVDVAIEDSTMEHGNLLLDLDGTYYGVIALDNVSLVDYQDYGVVIDAVAMDGSLELNGLHLEGPWGIQAKGDFRGLKVTSSELRVENTALDLASSVGASPTDLEGMVIQADVGIAARDAVVEVRDTNLTATTTPVRLLTGSYVYLEDCTLDVADLAMDVGPYQRKATLHIERHLEIGSVRWTVGDPIEAGDVTFYTEHENLSAPTPKYWSIGDTEPPLLRLMEWTRSTEGADIVDEKLVFTRVKPEMIIRGYPFQTTARLDPWEPGPHDLVFVDTVKPDISFDPGTNFRLTSPTLKVRGSVDDVGTGVESMTWLLMSSRGETLASGSVEHLAGTRWTLEMELPANNTRLVLEATDRTGNPRDLSVFGITVDVPSPTLTILQPTRGIVTNEPILHITGSAGWYAEWVEVYVIGSQVVQKATVNNGRFDVYYPLPNEGLNQVVVTCFDPFDGEDFKWVDVTLDTIRPRIEFKDLDPRRANYVTTPSLVVVGETDDPKATVTVLGQQVGLVDGDVFATTVQLAEGRQKIRVTATDLAGNREEVTLEVVLDTVPPDLVLVSPSSNPFWSTLGTVEVELSPSEALTALTQDGETVKVATGNVLRTVRLRHDGPTEVLFEAWDLAGNKGRLALTLHLDTELPVLTVVSPKSGSILNSTLVTLIVTSSEEGCVLSVNGNATGLKASSQGRMVGNIYLPGPEGVREVTLRLTDRAGNWVEETLLLDFDTIRPGISIDGLFDGARVTTEPLTVRGITEPGVKVVWVNHVMASVEPDGRFSAVIVLPEGWQDINVQAIDRAGNKNPANVRVKVLSTPKLDLPLEALAGGTIILAMGALVASTEVGRWGLLILFLPLYTKLRKDKILDQRTRGLIQGYITANPGCNYTIIRDNLDLADGTLTYHLQVLEREGFVYSIREGLFRCFYPQGVPPPRRGKLHLSDVQLDIIRISKRIPGITVGEIATAMNRRPNVISYHLKLLREGGLIRMEEDGRHVRVYPVESAVAMI